MGGQQSTRKVTVDNDNAIQVSQEAIERIQTQLAAQVNDAPLHNLDQCHTVINTTKEYNLEALSYHQSAGCNPYFRF